MRFKTIWDKTVFIGSIIGLIILISISLFRYYYLIPAQEKASKDYQYIHQLKIENKILKSELRELKNNLKDEEN